MTVNQLWALFSLSRPAVLPSPADSLDLQALGVLVKFYWGLEEPGEPGEQEPPDYAALVCWQIWDEDKWADLDRYISSIVGEAIVGEAIVGGQLNTTWATIRPCQNDTGSISHV